MSFGRPATRFEIDLNDPSACLEKLKYACSHEKIKKNILSFANQLLEIVGRGGTSKCSQTEFTTKTLIDTAFHEENIESFIDSVCDISKEMASYERSYLISLLISQMAEKDQVKMLFKFYEDLSLEGQSDMLGLLGMSLNRDLYKSSKENNTFSKDLDLEQLKRASKVTFYESCDIRLKNFIAYITECERSTSENVNFKSNVYENLLKARNSKFNCSVGVKEHMVAYLASGKSRHTSQVFSKQGGKATRPVLEAILKNSENVCKFKANEGSSLFFTFDNIQTLLKSHRIGGEHQKKVLTIVVCSTLCLQPDGDKKSKIQYQYQNCPAYWMMDYKYQAETQVFNKSIDAGVLKDCIKLDTEELKFFEEIFEKELEKALEFVKNDIDEDLQDSIDIQAKANIAKKRKLCANGHINDNVRANRKVCDREACNAPLDMGKSEPAKDVVKEQTQLADKVSQRANMYLNIPNVWSEDVPKEFAVG